MSLYGLAVLYALFLWWFSTGAILYLDGLPRRSFGWSMAGGTLLMVAALYGLVLTRHATSGLGAYAGFSCGLMIWGWLELGYYMGFFVGPRRQSASPASQGWRRFGQAIETTLYHECGALALAGLLAVITWEAPNRIGLWTFLILWSMQLSAKLNVFLGVPNLSEDFLPEQLGFLRSFMTRQPMNLFFPVSVTLGIVLTVVLAQKSLAAEATLCEAVGFTMLSTLMGLAILEHWFLVVPVPIDSLWGWSLSPRKPIAEGQAKRTPSRPPSLTAAPVRRPL